MVQYTRNLKKIDLFSNHIELSVDSQKTHKSIFGGVLTILLVLISLFAVVYFGQDMINSRKPKVTVQERYLDYSYLSSFVTQSSFAFRVLDETKALRNADVELAAFALVSTATPNSNGNTATPPTMIPIPLTSFLCSDRKDIFSTFANKNDFSFSSLQCVTFTDSLLNQYQEVLRQVVVKIYIRAGATGLNLGILETYFPQVALDVTSYSNPDVFYLDQNDFSLSSTTEHVISADLKSLSLKTDTGIVFTEFKQTSYVIPNGFTSLEKTIAPAASGTDQILATIDIQLYRREEITVRSYLKLQDFLSSVGGIIKVFSLIFVFISKRVTKLEFYIYLLNQIFNFEDPNDHNNHNNTVAQQSNTSDSDESAEQQKQDDINNKNKQKSISPNKKSKDGTDHKKDQYLRQQSQESMLLKYRESSEKNTPTLLQQQTGTSQEQTKMLQLSSPSPKAAGEGGIIIDGSKSEQKQQNQNDILKIDMMFLDRGDDALLADNNIYAKQNEEQKAEEQQQQEKGRQNSQSQQQQQQRRKSGIRHSTMIISKFMHKIQSMLQNSEQHDASRIEKIKQRLNNEGNQYIQPENKPLKWGFFDYVQNLFCFGQAHYKRQQMKFCWRKVKERLNAAHLMQKLVELEKLKILLLDEHQLKLFEYLPKPMISLDCTDEQTLQKGSPKHSTSVTKQLSDSIKRQDDKQIQPQKSISNNLKAEDAKNISEEAAGGTSKLILLPEDRSRSLTQKEGMKDSTGRTHSKSKQSCTTWLTSSNAKKAAGGIVQNSSPSISSQHRQQNKNSQYQQNTFHQQWIRLNSQMTPLEKALNALEAFECIKAKPVKTSIDNKLVDMLDTRMRKCFESAQDNRILEENTIDQPQNESEFKQFFDGDNTVREFLFPNYRGNSGEEGERKQRVRSRSLVVTPMNANMSCANQGNGWSNPSSGVLPMMTPIRKMRGGIGGSTPAVGGGVGSSGIPSHSNPAGRNDFYFDFTRYMHEYNKANQSPMLRSAQKQMLRDGGFAEGMHNNSFVEGNMTGRSIPKRNLLMRQKSGQSVGVGISSSSNNNNINGMAIYNKPSLFSRNQQQYQHEKSSPEMTESQGSSSYADSEKKKRRRGIDAFNQFNSRSANRLDEISNIPGQANQQFNNIDNQSDFDYDDRQSYLGGVKLSQASAFSKQPTKPTTMLFNRQLSAKNLNHSAVESDLNTIEEDVPQENNRTPQSNMSRGNNHQQQLQSFVGSSFQMQNSAPIVTPFKVGNDTSRGSPSQFRGLKLSSCE